MQMTAYAHRVELAIPFDVAVEAAVHELNEQGFGVLTWIDMKDKLKERLGVDLISHSALTLDETRGASGVRCHSFIPTWRRPGGYLAIERRKSVTPAATKAPPSRRKAMNASG